MTDRRRAPRYNLCRSITAEIKLLQDVSIQSASGDNVVVLASKFPEDCTSVLMEMVQPDGNVASLPAEILRTAPVLDSGVVRFRLELRVIGFASLSAFLAPAFG